MRIATLYAFSLAVMPLYFVLSGCNRNFTPARSVTLEEKIIEQLICLAQEDYQKIFAGFDTLEIRFAVDHKNWDDHRKVQIRNINGPIKYDTFSTKITHVEFDGLTYPCEILPKCINSDTGHHRGIYNTLYLEFSTIYLYDNNRVGFLIIGVNGRGSKVYSFGQGRAYSIELDNEHNVTAFKNNGLVYID